MVTDDDLVLVVPSETLSRARKCYRAPSKSKARTPLDGSRLKKLESALVKAEIQRVAVSVTGGDGGHGDSVFRVEGVELRSSCGELSLFKTVSVRLWLACLAIESVAAMARL